MTIAEIKKQITDKFISDEIIVQLYGLQAGKTFDDQFSTVSLESIIFSIMAAVYWSLHCLFDLHVKEVNDIISTKKPHNVRWYAHIAKQFRHGYNLQMDSDTYADDNLTAEELDDCMVVKHAAVVEQPEKLDIKVARNISGVLNPLTGAQLSAFTSYMERVKDAGVHLNIINKPADELRIYLYIYYNPLVLTAEGKRIDGTNDTPVADAVRQFLTTMPFNGELVLAYLVDALQAVDGVVIPDLAKCEYQYGGISFTPIYVKYLPLSGYFTIADEDLIIKYNPQNEILR